MKANELSCKDFMAGDWVIPHFDSMLEPSKIVGIHYNSYKGKDYEDWVDCEGLDEISLNNIKPIPLTPKILEKNGFKAREDIEYYYYDGYRINVDFYEGLPEDDIPPTIFLSIYFAEKDITMPIEYVHELQQAMRIMGCDKEIEL